MQGKIKMATRSIFIEIIVRILLGIAFIILEFEEPFHRKIQPEELWLYKNPRSASYIPTYLLWPIVFLVPLFVILVTNIIRRNKVDWGQAILGLSLSLGMNGILTNIIKLTVGRPRPDFYWRCFPDGKENPTLTCTGNHDEVIEGLKSFPSGHSSFSFASLGYCFLYLAGKLHVFTPRGRGESWRFLLSLSPLIIALLIAISRTCDYHHHWQDVLVGSIMGSFVTWMCYSQYYPSLSHPSCAIPLAAICPLLEDNVNCDQLKKMDNLQEISVKWI